MQENPKLSEFFQKIKGAKTAVMGIGISNRPLIRFLHKHGADIFAFDSLPKDDPVLFATRKQFEKDGIFIHWSCGDDYLSGLENEDFSYVFRTPKMRFDLPQLSKAVKKGSILTSELELFMELCPAKIFGVTGSDGKTTTTTLISEMLKKEGYYVYLGGNIGTPLLDQIEKVQPTDFVVLELSSFQLMSMKQSSDVAVVTNITPNHLDVHKDYQEYIDAKKNIYVNQGTGGRLVLNYDYDITREMAEEHRGELCFFSRKGFPARIKPLVFYTGIQKEEIVISYRHKAEPVLSLSDIRLPGDHNVENYMAAITAVYPYVSRKSIQDVAKSFPGVEHRSEFVREINGIRYYNSAIDTSPNRTIHTLHDFSKRGEKGVLLAGGADKKCDYTGLGKAILSVCDRIILCGSNAPLIRENLKTECADMHYQVYEVDSWEEAVRLSYTLAKEGEIVILSPVGTSYDRFRHFEERGNLFKQLVHSLPGL